MADTNATFIDITNILAEAKSKQIIYLNEIINKLNNFDAKAISIPLSIDCEKINDHIYIKDRIDKLPSKGRYIYYFSAKEDTQFIQSTFKDFIADKKSDTKLSKLNANHSGSLCLYVGSSNSLRKRFKEHCGFANNKTYALKLSHWLGNPKPQLSFNYIEVADADQLILQHLEDALWREFKPLFGKTGGNNKSQ
jgi:hypothetical protein